MDAANLALEWGDNEMSGTGKVDYCGIALQKLMIMREHIAPLLADDIPLSAEHQSVLAGLSAEVQEAVRVHLRARGIITAGIRDAPAGLADRAKMRKVLSAREWANRILESGVDLSETQEKVIRGLSGELDDALEMYQRQTGASGGELAL